MPEGSSFESFRQRFGDRADAGAKPALVVNKTREPYQAFGAKDKLHRVDLRTSDGLSHALPYSHLLLLTYNRRNYSEIFLTITGMAATIKGRNLRPIVEALKLHTCEFIQAFDAEEFNRPDDESSPYIESVNVEVIGARVPRETA